MPQLPGLDDFPYIGQEEDSLACVPACVEMVCEYLGIPQDRSELERELGYSVDDGTPFKNVGLLSGLRTYRIASVEEAVSELERGLPVIANVRIDDSRVLGYSGEGSFLHAVVLAGVDGDSALFFDPLSLVQLGTSAPTTCDRADFERAWRSGWVLTLPAHGF